MDGCGRRGNAAGLLQASPEAAQRPELGDGQELVLIDGDGKTDMRGGVDNRLARFLEQAEMARCDGQHGAQLLRLRCTGIVVDAAIGFQHDPRQVGGEEPGQRLRQGCLERCQRHAQAAGSGQRCRGIDPQREAQCLRVDVARAHVIDEPVGTGAAFRMHVHAQVDHLQMHAAQHLIDRLAR